MYDLIGSTAVNWATNHCPCPGYRQHTPPPHTSAVHFKQTCMSLQPWHEANMYTITTVACLHHRRRRQRRQHLKGCGRFRAQITSGHYYPFKVHAKAL